VNTFYATTKFILIVQERKMTHILAPNTSFKKRTVKYKCSVLWNSLPDHMKTWSSVAAFKRGNKKYLFLCAMMISS